MALDALRGVAQGIAGRALRTVAGNIRSGLLPDQRGGSNQLGSAALDTFSSPTAGSVQVLRFPLDVDSGLETGNHGHYMIFGIRKQTPPTINPFDRAQASGRGKQFAEEAQKQQDAEIDRIYSDIPPQLRGTTTKDDVRKSVVDRKAQELRKRAQTITTTRPSTLEAKAFIAMYMPPTVQVSYNTDYQDTERGAGVAIAAQAFAEYQSGAAGGEVLKKSLKRLGPEMGDGLMRAALGAVDMIPGLTGAQEAIEAQRGFVRAPQMELAFKGIAKRIFQYNFVMMPKSEEEAEQVRKIVQSFKENMLPEMTDFGKGIGKSVRRLNIPNTFDIEYMYAGQSNSNLHRIGECVLESMSVSYGGDRYKAYDNGMPVVTNLSLNFKELDLVTKEKAAEGF